MDIVQNVKDTIKAVLTGNFETVGQSLINKFDLGNYQYSYIQKIINYRPSFVITVDSRYPYRYISYERIKNIESSKLGIFEVNNMFKEFKLTPPVDLESFNIKIPSLAIVIVRDMAAEYYIGKVKGK
jgi:hypothetical protein